MKVKIGPYPNYYNAVALESWLEDTCGFKEETAQKIAYPYQLLCDLVNWLSPSEQKVTVKLDRYDTWAMHATLAHIVVPMLIQLKDTKHGSPHVDDSDVPHDLYNVNPGSYDVDEKWHDRWEYVISEMIFAFEKHKTDWESDFCTFDNTERIEGTDEFIILDKFQGKLIHDTVGEAKCRVRINNGLRLFAKYYDSLWD